MGIIKLSGKRGEILGGGGNAPTPLYPAVPPIALRYVPAVSASGLKSRLPLALLADDKSQVDITFY